MPHLQSIHEDSLARYIRLLSETIKRRFAKSYTVKTVAKKERYSYYLVKNNENPQYNLTVEAMGTLWTFTMNQGINRLTLQFDNHRLIDEQGIVSLFDIVQGTMAYQYNGSPAFGYQARKNKLSLEEYIYGGAREIDPTHTLRPISEAWVEELNLLKRNQNHFLTTLITAQITLQVINYGPLKSYTTTKDNDFS